MSRIGKLPIEIPQGVTVGRDGDVISVKGPKGELSMPVSSVMSIDIGENAITVTRPNDLAQNRSAHGLTRSLIANMVQGVSEGFTKKLEIVGVGFRAEMKGACLQLNLGFSHPIFFFPPEEITINVPEPTTIEIAGSDKQLVGEVAAKIRKLRPPEPYKGKGVKYEGEYIRRKAGKTAA
ncbi:MAG: 50S ribosomal protein L6 [Chlorobi bacterium]|nr:50S ribosomal protein L6 [Chlorobiota bacterium]